MISSVWHAVIYKPLYSVLVLLIAAVNLTNLTLARAVRRQGEVGVCLALGAHRGDIIRRFATENLLITLTGGAG